MTFALNKRPDAYGFHYSDHVTPDGDTIRVDIMPPVAHRVGDMSLEG